jgi:hypothetical protein
MVSHAIDCVIVSGPQLYDLSICMSTHQKTNQQDSQDSAQSSEPILLPELFVVVAQLSYGQIKFHHAHISAFNIKRAPKNIWGVLLYSQVNMKKEFI